MPNYIANILLYGKILRNKFLFDIYGNVDSFSFFKNNFKKNQEYKKILAKICH